MLANPVGRLRAVSLAEGVSFLILLTFSVLKRTNDWETGVSVMGPIHGVLFVLYVVCALDVRKRLAWSGATTAKVVLAAVLPFAPFFVERWLRTQKAPAQA